MYIKIQKSCVGPGFSYAKNTEVNAPANVAKDLISAGYAVEINKEPPKQKAGAKEDDNS